MTAMLPRLRRTLAMRLADAAVFVVALLCAYFVRFEFAIPPEFLAKLPVMLVLFVGVKMAVFQVFGLYRGLWRFTGFYELRSLVLATVSAFLILVGLVLFATGFQGFSRSIFVIDCLLTLVLAGSLRLGARFLHEDGPFTLGRLLAHRHACNPDQRRVLLIGAGTAGEMLLREMQRRGSEGYAVVGFLDDDPRKQGRSVHGVPVLGPVADVCRVVGQESVQEVLIAIPSASGEAMRRMVNLCEQAGAPFRTLPGLGEIIDGRVGLKDLRDVRFADLLGREPVDLEVQRISGYLAGKCVLVTGCGGSIGSELCRQIVRFRPKRLILLDSGEYNLYQIQTELAHEYGFSAQTAVLGSLADGELLEQVFASHAPQVVFHAAAYKHVPLLEHNPWQAVNNNILPSLALIRTALAHEVERFVLVSTDKAVNPSNVMGASKRVTELLLQAHAGRGTQLMGVRFGNVIGSSGSVIPLFMRQIAHGGPVTVTHPDVTRYFMTIPEAAQLILQAGSMGGEAEIYVLKMGRPVRIAEMARDLIRLAGKEPDKDIEVRYVGLRAGEKLYEELVATGEAVEPTQHAKIMRLQAAAPAPADAARLAVLEQAVAELARLADLRDANGIRAALMKLVPEYRPAEQDNATPAVGASATTAAPRSTKE